MLSGFFFFAYRQSKGPLLKSIAIGLSAGFAFLQFCATVIHATIITVCCNGQKPRPYVKGCEPHNQADHRMKGDADKQRASGYRDSIFDESDDEPLLPTY